VVLSRLSGKSQENISVRSMVETDMPAGGFLCLMVVLCCLSTAVVGHWV
jgi:hypothetical protein